MALLQDIRKRSGLLTIVIGLALALFLLSDIFSSGNFSFLGKSQEDLNPTVLKVNGQKIDRFTFDQIVDQSIKVRELNGMVVDESMRQQLRAEAANQLFNDMAIEPILDNLGIDIADKEYGQLIAGEVPHPFIQQYFQQQYNPEVMKRFLQNEYQNDQRYKYAMDEIVRAIKTQVKAEKYNALVRSGFQATDFDAEAAFSKGEIEVSGQIVLANYLSVADSLVDVSDREMENYISKNKEEYQVEASRDLEYIEWIAIPSAGDSAVVFEQVNDLRNEFAATENDSVYVARNSDIEYNPVFRSHGSFGGEAEDKLFAANTGDVVGPIAGDGGFGVYKILEKQTGSQMYYNFSQIVLNLSLDTAAVYGRARQLIAEIEGGASFEAIARANSNDPSANNGGKMGWVSQAPYIPESVIQYAGKASPGTLGIVRGTSGLHIVRVNASPSNEMVKVVGLVRKVQTSRETKNELFSTANRLAVEINSKDEFDFSAKASAQKLNVKNASDLAPGAQGWTTLPNAREIIKWAFKSETKKGAISEPFSIENRIVLVRVKTLVEKGTASLESVRDDVKRKLENVKKAEILKDKIAKIIKESSAKDDAVSLAIALGTVAQKIENAKYSQTSMFYVGNDYKVQGVVLGMKKGERTIPVAGEQGVYVFFCNNVTTSPKAPDLEGLRGQLTMGYQQGIETKIDEILKKKTGLENLFDKYY